VATFAVYFQTRNFDFVNFDDPEYVSQNAHLKAGLTGDGIVWAFTSTESANWFPLTRLSYLLDVELFGLQSGWHHLMNVFFHGLAVVLLFAFLRRATGSTWPSALVAFVFALHPLHVESVAWIAERKDVLSAFFWFLALWCYVRYIERPSAARYAMVAAAFCLGLMAKPMIVTLPLVLLLVDVWPLRRRPALKEKLPLFAIAIAGAIATFVVQQQSGAVRELASVPFGMRIENALVSYAVYLEKTLWPAGLAVFYPYPKDIPIWEPAAALVLLTAITVFSMRQFRARPYFAAGWFWFLVTLAPVIGIVQVGGQARADRYMYVPMIGLLILVAWGGLELVERRPRLKTPALALAILACCAFTPVTWAQIGYWQNGETLFAHAVAVTEDNYLAQHNLGSALLNRPGRLDEAATHLREAVRLNPDSVRARTDLGSALAKMGRYPEAIAEFQAALKLDASAAILHHNLGNALLESGRTAEAIAEYENALRLDPGYSEARHSLAAAHYSRGIELAKSAGHAPEAIAELEAALRIQPDYAEAHNNLGVVLSQIPGKSAEAVSHLREAVRLRPDYADARYNLALALAESGHVADAITVVQAGLRMASDPQLQELLGKLQAAK
jgi:tetratricopeptide (TPR) repeat protein